MSTPVALMLLMFFVMAGMMLAMVVGMFCTAEGWTDATKRNGILWLTVFQDLLMFILPAAVLAIVVWKRPLAGLYMDKAPSWNAVAVVIAMQVVGLPLMNWIVDWNNGVVFPDAVERVLRSMEDVAAVQTRTLLTTDTLWQMLAGVLVIGFLAALSEEMLFRGAILGRWLDDKVNCHVAIWAVAVLFSAIHMQFYGFVPRMLLGAWLGYLLVWTRSLWVPVLAHALNNSIVVVAWWLDGKGFVDGDAIDRIGVPQAGQFPLLATLSLVATLAVIAYSLHHVKQSPEDKL